MATYTIKKGDTLYRIARQHGTTVDELTSLNNISNRNIIHPGVELKLPRAKTQGEAVPQVDETVQQPQTTVPTTSELLSEHESNAPTYQQSQELQDALQNLSDFGANKPGEYQSQYSDQISGMLDDILNREDFSYSFNADPMYQQYKTQYQQMGERAMADTMGNVAQLSGGYGNSYAQTAGHQQYNQHMQQLNNVIPALRDAAHSMYQAEGNEMKNQLAMIEGMDEKEYGLYRDEVADYNQEYNRLYNEAQNMEDEEYTKYLNDYRAWESERNYLYGKSQDEQAQDNWQTQWDYQVEQNEKNSRNRGSRGDGEKNGYLDLMKKLKEGNLTFYDIDQAIKAGSLDELQAANLQQKLKEYFASFTGHRNGQSYINGQEVTDAELEKYLKR